MGLDRTRWPELMLGLDRVRVLDVARDSDDRLHVLHRRRGGATAPYANQVERPWSEVDVLGAVA